MQNVTDTNNACIKLSAELCLKVGRHNFILCSYGRQRMEGIKMKISKHFSPACLETAQGSLNSQSSLKV